MKTLLFSIFNIINPMFFISVCRHIFGFDPQTKVDKLVMLIAKKRYVLFGVIFTYPIIFLLLMLVHSQEIRTERTIDRKSPPPETWVNPDIDMNSPLMRVLVNSKRE